MVKELETVATEEVIIDGGHEEGSRPIKRARRGLPRGSVHQMARVRDSLWPTKVCLRSISLLPGWQLHRQLQSLFNHKSSSFSRYYTKLKSVKATQPMTRFSASDQLSYDNHPFFKGLHSSGEQHEDILQHRFVC